MGLTSLRAGLRLSRPDQVLLIVVVLGVGVVAGHALAAETGGWLAALAWTTPSVTAIAVSVHAINEYADADTDALTVRSRFSGGSGALHDHGLPPVFALRLAVTAAALGIGLAVAGWAAHHVSVTVLALLLTGLVGGWAYSVGPWPFSRHAAGEVANAVLGGLLLPATGAVVAGARLETALLVFVPFALLDLVNLLETQWADRTADRLVGKHTLASRLTPRRIRVAGGAAAMAAYVLAPALQPWPVAAAGLLAAPLSAYGVWRLGTGRPGPSVAAMVVFLLVQGLAWVAWA